MRHIFLSPHYDDAVYSCGGTIYDLVQSSNEVIIYTLMAGIPTSPPDTPVLRDNHSRWQAGDNPIQVRRLEDKTATDILGAKTRYFDLLDCIYRVVDGEPLYPTEASLWTNIHPKDTVYCRLQTIKIEPNSIVYAPLGVGEHVDHLLVRNWGWKLAQKTNFTVKFYIEYPYLRSRQSVEKAYHAMPEKLNSIKNHISEVALQKKIEAMTAYKSQIASFWEAESHIAQDVKQTFTMNGEFVEEYAVKLREVGKHSKIRAIQ